MSTDAYPWLISQVYSCFFSYAVNFAQHEYEYVYYKNLPDYWEERFIAHYNNITSYKLIFHRPIR